MGHLAPPNPTPQQSAREYHKSIHVIRKPDDEEDFYWQNKLSRIIQVFALEFLQIFVIRKASEENNDFPNLYVYLVDNLLEPKTSIASVTDKIVRKRQDFQNNIHKW